MFHIYAAYLVNFESAIEIIRKALESRSDIFGAYLRVSVNELKSFAPFSYSDKPSGSAGT